MPFANLRSLAFKLIADRIELEEQNEEQILKGDGPARQLSTDDLRNLNEVREVLSKLRKLREDFVDEGSDRQYDRKLLMQVLEERLEMEEANEVEIEEEG